MTIETYVTDVFKGTIPQIKFTSQISGELNDLLSDAGWRIARIIRVPPKAIYTIYEVRSEESIVGLGFFDRRECNLPQNSYTLYFRVVASSREKVEALRSEAQDKINPLMKRLDVKNVATSYVEIAPIRA